jgi:putative radical SAM enzyme (TIGR03279 family)
LAHYGIIAKVQPDSIASELLLEPGDKIIAVNGTTMNDLIDLSFAWADENIELLVEKKNGEQEIFEIEKDYDEELGIEFESAVFDGIRQCANKCIFCFVDQLAPNMRKSLYVKDDDYRLSFLYGNFVTLTNLGPNDVNRIRQFHLSPLYVSIHTTDGALRQKMLGNKKAGLITEQLGTLIDNGVEVHTQVVLCPEINDGLILEQTFKDLRKLHPGVLSMAIVPVGLSKYREGCFPLRVFSKAEAEHIIETVSSWQEECRGLFGHSFVYLADEFYLSAGHNIPEYEFYDEFPQIENGVGIVRTFLHDWQQTLHTDTDRQAYPEPVYLDVVCGISAEKILRPLLEDLHISNLSIRLIPVKNEFFGSHITVTGLLTGKDIENILRTCPGPRTGVIIPGIALRKGESMFLDNMSPVELAVQLKTEIRAAYGAIDLYELLTAWR